MLRGYIHKTKKILVVTILICLGVSLLHPFCSLLVRISIRSPSRSEGAVQQGMIVICGECIPYFLVGRAARWSKAEANAMLAANAAWKTTVAPKSSIGGIAAPQSFTKNVGCALNPKIVLKFCRSAPSIQA